MKYFDRTRETAERCIEIQKGNKTFRGAVVGKMLREFSGYRIGDYVLVDDVRNGDCVIEMPMTEEAIIETRKSGSLITTVLTTICFPANGVEIMSSEAGELTT